MVSGPINPLLSGKFASEKKRGGVSAGRVVCLSRIRNSTAAGNNTFEALSQVGT